MDAYEATRVVLGRIQRVDPENAAKIMGLLLLQDHGEKEMIRLAFGPEPLLLSAISKARNDLGLPPLSPFRLNQDELVSPSNPTTTSPFYGGGGGDLVDELQLHDQLGYLNDGAGESGIFSSYPIGWSGIHRRSCSAAELCMGADAAGGYGWRPCLYFARGYCKNGSSCRFVHGLPDDAAAALAGAKMDAAVEQQCHELLLRSKSQRLGNASHFMASAFPYSPAGSVPRSPSSSSKAMSFLLQQQPTESQRAAAAAAALMLGGDEAHRFMARSPRMERSDFAGMVNPGSRQIYLTFPADSTFREEDVSNYFSIYGPVQDVRIPYQQKRMFGFVTFVYPETVKLILAKGNPHFVCDSRVLVKPYKEKGKVPDKYRKQQQQGERGDFSGFTTPTALDARDAYDLQQLGVARMLCGGISQEAVLRRRLEEQQQAAELQQAIELQSRRFMGLQLLDLKSRSLPSSTTLINSPTISTPTNITIHSDNRSSRDQEAVPSLDNKSQAGAAAAAGAVTAIAVSQTAVDTGTDKEESAGQARPNEDSGFQESAEHNLPDSPFASPTKSSFAMGTFAAASESDITATAASPHNSSGHLLAASSLLPPAPTLDMPSFKSCFLQMPRFSSGPGAVGM